MTSTSSVGQGAAFDRSPFTRIEGTLNTDPQAWIETHHLLAALKRNARKPVPVVVLAHLRARLDGTAKKRRGRGRRSAGHKLRDILISLKFDRTEAWLNARQQKQGLKGWPSIRNAEWWQGPPSERAARMVQHRLELNLDWQRVRNIAYEIRKNGMPII
jgi:hypothetical protein